MASKEEIKAELAGVLQGVRPRPNMVVGFGRRQRAEAIGAMWTCACDLGFDGDFARYLLDTFGTVDLSLLSDGDVRRAARYLDACAQQLQAAS